MVKNRFLIIQQLQKCIKMINALLDTLNHKNMLRNIFSVASEKYSVKGLSLQRLKPKSALAYITKIQMTLKHLSDSELQLITKNPILEWCNSQYKIFAWICILYASFQGKSINMDNEELIQFIQQLFYRKSSDFILYNLRRLTSNNHVNHKWTSYDDQLLDYLARSIEEGINIHWSRISFQLFIRSQRQSFFQPHHCRQRWINHLNPSVSKQKWTQEQDIKLISKIIAHGKKWAFIASSFFKDTRTQHMIKNRYNSIVRKNFRKGAKVDFKKLTEKLFPSSVYLSSIQNITYNLPSRTIAEQLPNQPNQTSNTIQQMNQEIHDNSSQINNNMIVLYHSTRQPQIIEADRQQNHPKKIKPDQNQMNLLNHIEIEQDYLNSILF